MNKTLPFLALGILAVTLLAKAASFFSGSITGNHDWLPLTNRQLTLCAILLEVGLLAVWRVFGVRRFMQATLAASIGFLAFHVLNSAMGGAPCPCLGGAITSSVRLANMVSIALATLLFGVTACWHLLSDGRPSLPSVSLAPELAALAFLVAGTGIAILFGSEPFGDESMEAAKALLAQSDPASFEQMWNDQSPILTLLWSLLPLDSYVPGRLLVVALWAAGVFGIASAIGLDGIGLTTLALPVGLLLAIPESVITMTMEPAAYATACLAWLLLVGKDDPDRKWLWLAAYVAGLALAMKPTAAFALVAPFVWLWVRSPRRAMVFGGYSIGIWLILLGVFLPEHSWAEAFASHATTPPRGQYEIELGVVGAFWPLGLLATYGIASRVAVGNWRHVAPWAAAFVVALSVHALHRPWWPYYNLHLFVPLCVLAAYGLHDLVRLPRAGWPLASAAVTSFGLVLATFNGPFANIRLLRSDEVGAVGRTIKALGVTTAFGEPPGPLVAAGMNNAVPHLTIIPAKRQWAGLTDEAIWEAVSNAAPDAIVFEVTRKIPDGFPYRPAVNTNGFVIWLRSDIPGQTAVMSDERNPLRALGL